jgi:hypothetical protein
MPLVSQLEKIFTGWLAGFTTFFSIIDISDTMVAEWFDRYTQKGAAARDLIEGIQRIDSVHFTTASAT